MKNNNPRIRDLILERLTRTGGYYSSSAINELTGAKKASIDSALRLLEEHGLLTRKNIGQRSIVHFKALNPAPSAQTLADTILDIKAQILAFLETHPQSKIRTFTDYFKAEQIDKIRYYYELLTNDGLITRRHPAHKTAWTYRLSCTSDRPENAHLMNEGPPIESWLYAMPPVQSLIPPRGIQQ